LGGELKLDWKNSFATGGEELKTRGVSADLKEKKREHIVSGKSSKKKTTCSKTSKNELGRNQVYGQRGVGKKGVPYFIVGEKKQHQGGGGK